MIRKEKRFEMIGNRKFHVLSNPMCVIASINFSPSDFFHSHLFFLGAAVLSSSSPSLDLLRPLLARFSCFSTSPVRHHLGQLAHFNP